MHFRKKTLGRKDAYFRNVIGTTLYLTDVDQQMLMATVMHPLAYVTDCGLDEMCKLAIILIHQLSKESDLFLVVIYNYDLNKGDETIILKEATKKPEVKNMFMEISLLLLFVNNVCFTISLYEYYHDGTDYSVLDDDTSTLSSLDIQSVFTDSFNGEESYAGLFLCLAWHAAGTFCDTDGEGGAGGRIRFPPEASWMYNANLHYARALVRGIKEKYCNALSCGDLFVFALLQRDGPVGQICAGRIDNTNRSLLDVLNYNSTCNTQGNCISPLRSAQVGLIYANAQGVFARMDINDSEAVTSIGDYAFGKAHSSDVGASGIEGQSAYRFERDNEYLHKYQIDYAF